MNYELVMLKNAVRMKRSANILVKEMKILAMRSYDVANWRDGTIGQMQAIAELSQKIEHFNKFYSAVERALKLLSPALRALLVVVYIKNTDKKLIADKYKVSVSTVYRKLLTARERFRNALLSMGYDERWFKDNYDGYDWIVSKKQ